VPHLESPLRMCEDNLVSNLSPLVVCAGHDLRSWGRNRWTLDVRLFWKMMPVNNCGAHRHVILLRAMWRISASRISGEEGVRICWRPKNLSLLDILPMVAQNVHVILSLCLSVYLYVCLCDLRRHSLSLWKW
jgi:hypothetical protein